MSDCKRKAYITSIAAKVALTSAGFKPKAKDVEKCRACGRWHVREGLL